MTRPPAVVAAVRPTRYPLVLGLVRLDGGEAELYLRRDGWVVRRCLACGQRTPTTLHEAGEALLARQEASS